jgi:putative hydrolase of HD superfamily
METIDLVRVVNFVFELAQLRVKPRTGWELLRIPEKESVSDHIMRAAQLAFILAVMEHHPEPEHVAVKVLFHDNNETRLPDANRVAMRYIVGLKNNDVVKDQTEGLGEAGAKILMHWRDVEYPHLTLGGVIAKDADYLECAFTAKEYIEQGHVFASDWTKNVRAALRTESARRLFDQMMTMTSHDWWQGLKKAS